MASEDLKHLVAREMASGETIAEVARRHGYSWKGMKKLLDSPEMLRPGGGTLHEAGSPIYRQSDSHGSPSPSPSSRPRPQRSR